MQVNGYINVFGKEMSNIVCILVIFDLSFILRLIADFVLTDLNLIADTEICGQHACKVFQDVIYDIVTQYAWDYIPIMAILLFHRSNFKLTE